MEEVFSERKNLNIKLIKYPFRNTFSRIKTEKNIPSFNKELNKKRRRNFIKYRFISKNCK